MKLVNYENKYIKYKNKYLEIKNIIQKGGMDCNNDRVFQNILGTCWMIVIQMIICFGEATKNDLEEEMKKAIQIENIEYINCYLINLIEIKRDELECFFPSDYLKIEERETFLLNLLRTFIIRYWAKLNKPLTKKPLIFSNNKDRCELVMNLNFKNLFSFYSTTKTGGDFIDQFYFANILGIFLLNQKIYFANYTRKNFKNIAFYPEQDIGILFYIEQHVFCGLVCEGVYKLYNDNDKKIYDCDWINLLLELQPNEDLFVVTAGLAKLDRTEYFDNIEKYDNYKRIQWISVISKRVLEDNINNQISIFFNDNYEINDFFLLNKIGLKYYQKNDYCNAFDYYIKAAEHGYYHSQNIIGEMYNDGIGVDMNKDKALEYFELAFNNGSVAAS